MLDIVYIRENIEKVKQAAKNKNVEVDIDKLLQLDETRRKAQTEIDKLRSERNQLASGGKKPSETDVKKGQDLKAQINQAEAKLKAIGTEHAQLLYKVPNVPADDVPIGKDESANKVLRQWGDKPTFEFKPKPHWELGQTLDVIDDGRAAKVAGARFTYLKGRLVLLHFALLQYVLDLLTDETKLTDIINQMNIKAVIKPFTPVLGPDMLKPDVFARTGRLDPAEDKYFLEKDDLYLAGSAEQTLAPLHMDEVLAEEVLPLRYVGYSTAFRREAGSYGKDTRGIIRMHQFDKLEMQTVCSPEQSDSEFELYVGIQEYLMQQLGLPYQAVANSTGDMGKPDYRQIDIEAWMAGQDAYRETHTADNNTDYQARRLNVQYKNKDGQKRLVHMHDGTALSMRPLIAIIENNQTKEGKVKVPVVLQSYLKGDYL